jgi:hypothetical protein
MSSRYALSLAALLGIGIFVGRALAQTPPPGSGAAAKPPAAAVPTNCKVYGPGKCCDPAISAHLTKQAVMTACGETEATFLGEQGSKDTCKYFFKVEGQKEDETFVQVYAPAQKDVPAAPNDPFFKWGKIGNVFYTEKALSPKSAPMVANATGLWLPGKGYVVAINASTKVCNKAEAKKLAAKMK